MHRRDIFRLGGGGLLLAVLPGCLRAESEAVPPDTRRLFFEPSDLPRIRANARTPLLRPIFEAWRAESPDLLRTLVDKVAETGNLLYDERDALQAMERSATVHLIEPSEARLDALRYGIQRMIELPKWDYMLDGGTEVLGLMRSSMATSRLLFAREVLGSELDADLEARLLDAIAEKGVEPCYRTIVDMERPETVKGWSFDANHQSTYEIDMSRWPEILGANNLRAVPTMGLGLGALALEGRDERAQEWIDMAIVSARRFLGFFSPDGSYFEGLSYVDYALRTLLMFINAHQRLHGSIDWTQEVNFDGVVGFILAMQAGRHDDGTPDIVNFSDARKSVYPCIPAWIARTRNNPVAQFAAQEVSEPGFFLDFLWYEPERPAAPPPDDLKNARLALDWVIARSGWQPEDAVLAFRSGGPANHEHADRNSFLYKRHGERLLTDHFGAAYDWREPGWLLRLTEAHNAVLVDGKGHQYHNGEEGTNESLAESSIVRFEPDGNRVWWSSDATPAYQLVDPDIQLVRRTVVFAKPNLMVLFDEVQKESAPSTVELRFFPDNRDGNAMLEAGKTGFVIRRPKARLRGFMQGQNPLHLATDQLDLPVGLGVFPYVQAASERAQTHEIVTVLVARPAEAGTVPKAVVEATNASWTVTVDGQRLRIDTAQDVPEVVWG